MNAYQQEQLDSLLMVRQQMNRFTDTERERLKDWISGYLEFRSRVAKFTARHFETVCTDTCYRDRLSACCSRDGIITFFGDVVINALISAGWELDRMEAAIRNPANSVKCIYLTGNGCQWRVKPIVCEMFLCDAAREKVFSENPGARDQWERFELERKSFTWPDKPVLFETLEAEFISAGCLSPLMYIHNSPGLRRIREKRG